MTRPIKILLSSRDPGTVGNIIELYRLMADDPDFEIRMIASGVASIKMREADIDHIEFNIKGDNDYVKEYEDPKPLLDKALCWLDKINPDLTITSVSSLGAGIDEALIYHSNSPVFAFQDFWGDVNCMLGKTADEYFVLDEFASQLSKDRWNVKTRITGMPKYLTYKTIPFQTLKLETRKKLGIADHMKLIGWFGQPVEVPGYQEAFNSFIRSCTRLTGDYAVMIKAHPKDQDKNIVAKIHIPGLKILNVTQMRETESLLAASDIVVTPFSLCGLDHAVMSSFANGPLGVVLYLMPNQEIRDFAKTVCGMDKFPIVDKSGVGFWLDSDDPDRIALEIIRLMSQEESQKYFMSCSNVIRHFDYKKFKSVIR